MSPKPTTKPAPLGRGLSALFGDTDASYRPTKTQAAAPVAANAVPAQNQGVRTMSVASIQPGVFQPRMIFDETAIDELASSIRERGVLQPLMVRPIAGEKDMFEIICGERRWRAAQKAGLHDVPVIVRHFTDKEAMEIGLIENIQRQDLSPIEEADGYRRLIEEFNHTHENLAKIVGKSRPHIGNILRLLKLPGSVKMMINKGELSMGHARCVITAKDPEKLAREIVKKGLNVRQAEALAKREAEGPITKKTSSSSSSDANIMALERDLQRSLGLKAEIKNKGLQGTVILHYRNMDQLEDLLKRLTRPHGR